MSSTAALLSTKPLPLPQQKTILYVNNKRKSCLTEDTTGTETINSRMMINVCFSWSGFLRHWPKFKTVNVLAQYPLLPSTQQTQAFNDCILTKITFILIIFCQTNDETEKHVFVTRKSFSAVTIHIFIFRSHAKIAYWSHDIFVQSLQIRGFFCKSG